MASQTGLGDALYIGGYDLSGDIQALGKITAGGKPIDVTGINKFGMERILGIRDGAIDMVTFFNTAANQEHARLSPLPLTDVITTYVRGTVVGAPTANITAKQANYNLKRGKSGDLTFDVNMLANGQGTIWGQTLSAGIRTDTTATNGTALDFGGVSSAFGLEVWYHLLTFTGTSVILKLQDSADNVTFADLAGTATSALTTAGQATYFAIVGTIRRYVRVVTVGTFNPASFIASFARNETAVAL
jgi:hypothetical protein